MSHPKQFLIGVTMRFMVLKPLSQSAVQTGREYTHEKLASAHGRLARWRKWRTYVTAHSPTLPSLYLRHNSFPNPCVASPTSQLIFQSLFRFYYVTGSSLTSPGESPMLQFLGYIFSIIINVISESIPWGFINVEFEKWGQVVPREKKVWVRRLSAFPLDLSIACTVYSP